MADHPQAAPAGPTPTILEAIVTRRCVTASYNRQPVVLAPHVLFNKHDALHVGAVTVERGGQPPREPKLGVFKLDGLGEIAITDRPFSISELWQPDDERFVGKALLAVEN
ncbi:MAG: hypothetical protein J0I47_03360 [Sphingomonas sp.]|uniref:hypothetical protein n=1 Tax=Sphingomonas sp. TaxID=28214 RepID=UPI001AD0D668|nr:hypothetical protein [Sphingomonas sp.]MBN8807265.1 hypothetical protein [Sphingomonas sp.]